MSQPSIGSSSNDSVPLALPAGLDRQHWGHAARRLLAKMISEFAYEEILQPHPEPGPAADAYKLIVDDALTVRFRARRGAYGHWSVDPSSLDDGLDPLVFFARAHNLLGLSCDTTGHYLRELTATLTADARLLASELPVAELASLGYAQLEGHMDGHPWLVANKGRLGFSATDTARWAPEGRTAGPLPWIAVREGLAEYRGVPRLGRPHQLYARELSPETLLGFHETLRSRGLPRRSISTCPCIPGSGTRPSRPCSPPRSPREPSCRSARTAISGCPSSPYARSSTPAGPTGTPSSCRSPS